MNSIIVTHESDVDGVFSASIALMRYPQSKLVFSSYGKDNFLRISDLIYKEVVSSQGKGQVIFTDLPPVKYGNKTPLESLLSIERITPKLPDVSKLPKNLDNFPAWKKAAYQQAKNINPG